MLGKLRTLEPKRVQDLDLERTTVPLTFPPPPLPAKRRDRKDAEEADCGRG